LGRYILLCPRYFYGLNFDALGVVMTEREMIFYLAERAGIVFRLTSTDVTVEKLQRFLELVEGHRTRGWRIKEPKARKVTDVSRGAREVPIDYDGMATFKKEWEWKEMDTVDYRIQKDSWVLVVLAETGRWCTQAGIEPDSAGKWVCPDVVHTTI